MKSPVHPNFQRKPSSQGGQSAPLAPRGFSVSVAMWGALASAAAVAGGCRSATAGGEAFGAADGAVGVTPGLAQLDTGLSLSLFLSLNK